MKIAADKRIKGFDIKSEVRNLIQIAVVDDEKIIQEQIKNLIEESMPGSNPDSFRTGEGLLTSEKQLDIVFLDIQLEGMNGIDTAKMFRKKQPETVLIFITGSKEYVFQAFDVLAFHYLLKPIQKEKFKEVFSRAIMEAEKRKKQKQESLFIKTRNRSFTIDKDSILYVESRAKKAEIHTLKEILEIYASMNGLEKQLGKGFYRCHRGYLVNMAYITEYNNDSILLKNGETIYLAKEKYHEFVKEYMRYLRNEWPYE